MKGLLITFAAILALSNSAPQGVEFSAKEYQALQSALGDRIPVAIQSAIRILAGSESNPTDFVVLNFPGLGGQVARVGGAAGAGNVPVARTGVAAAETTAAAAAEAKEAEITVAAAVEAEPATAEAPRGKRQQMLEAFRRKRQQMEAARIKRQQEEQRTRYATELSFGLSALGNLYGGNIGRYLDDTYNAHLTLIQNMERTNLLVLDQIEEMFLNRPHNKTRRSVSPYN